MTTIDVGRLLVDVIEDVGRLGGGNGRDRSGDHGRPADRGRRAAGADSERVGGAAAPRFCRCGHSQRDHQADLFFCRAKVFTGVPCDCRGFVDEERIGEEVRS